MSRTSRSILRIGAGLAAGVAAATVTESGRLPNGLTFTQGTAGTATIAGTARFPQSVTVTLKAANGATPVATQRLTVVAGSAPVIVTGSSSRFRVGKSGIGLITAVGYPTATLTLSGTLPKGLTFHRGALGIGYVSGRPAPGTEGTYGVTITAANAFGNAVQQYKVIVQR